MQWLCLKVRCNATVMLPLELSHWNLVRKISLWIWVAHSTFIFHWSKYLRSSPDEFPLFCLCPGQRSSRWKFTTRLLCGDSGALCCCDESLNSLLPNHILKKPLYQILSGARAQTRWSSDVTEDLDFQLLIVFVDVTQQSSVKSSKHLVYTEVRKRWHL